MSGADDRAWMALAACRGYDPETWFPGEGRGPRDTTRARRICVDCPVRQQCADYAIATSANYGIWGGLTVNQRNRIARDRAGGIPGLNAKPRASVSRCPADHPYDSQNTGVNGGRNRRCRACDRISAQRRRAAKAVAA